MPAQPFNAFQQVMRLWDRVHPYNAAQMLHLTGPADIDRWNRAWRDTLAALRVGQIRELPSHYEHDAPENPRAVERIPADMPIEDWLEGPMNLLFDTQDGQPFLPFVRSGDDTSHVGIVYRHWVADSVSIRQLLREWFLRVHDPVRARAAPLKAPAGGLWHYFGPQAARWELDQGLAALFRLRTRFSRVRQLHPVSGASMAMRFSLHRLPDGAVHGLLALARHGGFKLTDLFLACMAMACDEHGVNPRVPGREDLAFGTIVDMRPMSSRLPDDVFGMFLGFTTTIVRGSDLGDWHRLLRNIAAQSELHRRTRAAPAGVLRLAAGLLESRFLPPDRWCERYRRQMPLAAGLSNVNLTSSWAARYHPEPIREYIRVSPVGPLLPLVLTPTTLGNKLHIGMSRQASRIDEIRAGRIIGTVIDRLGRVV